MAVGYIINYLIEVYIRDTFVKKITCVSTVLFDLEPEISRPCVTTKNNLRRLV